MDISSHKQYPQYLKLQIQHFVNSMHTFIKSYKNKLSSWPLENFPVFFFCLKIHENSCIERYVVCSLTLAKMELTSLR